MKKLLGLAALAFALAACHTTGSTPAAPCCQNGACKTCGKPASACACAPSGVCKGCGKAPGACTCPKKH